ncbi:MAG: hypothetical protein GYB37_10935 [Algicola sp.]|nr:hypothetical protein [Algicola sp.]
MKFRFTLLALLGILQIALAQSKYERESRIEKNQFPAKSYMQIQEYLENAKRIRFYQEMDSTKKSYEAKFKKGRLYYSVEFNEQGSLEDIEFKIKERDIPNATWGAIQQHLTKNHNNYRVKKIQQQYPVSQEQSVEKTLYNAFQNLILPEVNYELVFSTKEKDGFQEYEALFNADGTLIAIRKSFPPSYDHVLY